jgi:putative ATP-binding cassette transporter
MLLDEWAANQDPSFRWIFYGEILPDLKRQGRTLIAISHDDRHFSAVDRYIRLEDGRIVEEVRPVSVSSRPIAPPSQTTPDRCDTDPGTSVSSPSLSADR